MARHVLTEPTFILGSLYPAGSVLDIDPKDYGLKSADDTYVVPREVKAQPYPLAPNLVPAGKDAGGGEYAVAAIAPTGPNPTAPQAVPPDSTQFGNSYVTSAGDAITPETADTGKGK